MLDLETRLMRCFSSVFAELSPEEIRAASAESLSAWDSLAAVTLIAVLQQEFEVQISLADYPKLKSFDAVERYLRSRNGAGQAKLHSTAAGREAQ